MHVVRGGEALRNGGMVGQEKAAGLKTKCPALQVFGAITKVRLFENS